jgi:hypothetical protein
MMTDEEILHKATLLLEQISQNPDLHTESILREISEPEMKGVAAILQKIAENPKGVLAFDELFGDKVRLVMPFPVKDESSELGQWVYELEQNLEVKPSYEKGMLSIDREWEDNDRSIDDDVESVWGGGTKPKMIKKKLQVKIGRYFTKLDELIKEYKEMRQKIGDHKYGVLKKDYSNISNTDPGTRWMLEYTGGDIEDALKGKELKRYHKLQNSLELYMGSSSHGAVSKYMMRPSQQEEWVDTEQNRRDAQDAEDVRRGHKARKRKPIVAPETGFKIMGDYWVDNAKYVKENINDLETDQYSIILTRHPIDVMRMSDFEKITSCHTPPSRAEAEQPYYKCAVAEAQGHGAIAYVVATDDLLSQTNTSNIDSAQQELEEYDEIFAEQDRWMSGTNLGLDPVSRTRLRQFRYFRDFDGKDKPYEGKELAVPEKAIYGLEIPGLINTVTKWARKKQENLFEKLPRKDGKINLDNFEIYGGSYEDTAKAGGRKILMMNLTQLQSGEFIGDVKQNKETEEDLPPDWLGDVGKILESGCKKVREEWNPEYANCQVDYFVRNDGSGTGPEDSYWVVYPEGKFKLTWPVDEWSQLPNPVAGSDAVEYLNEYFGDLFEDEGAYIGRWGDEIIFRCEFIVKMVPNMGGKNEYVFDSDGFKKFCEGIKELDNRRNQFKTALEKFAKQEGWIDAGAYANLVREIEQGNIDSYYWDVEYDGEHFEESYEAWAGPKDPYDFDPEDLGVEPRILFEIVDSREFRINLRWRLLALAQKEVATKYHLDIRDSSAVDSGGDVRYSISFKVTLDDPDERSALFKELVTGEMDDEDEISKAFMSALQEVAGRKGVKLNLEGYA